MKETPKHRIKYPEGTDLVRSAAQQFEAMAQSIDDNIDDLPDTITQKVTAAQQAAEAAAATAEKFGGQAQALQDEAVSALISSSQSLTSQSLADLVYTRRNRIRLLVFGDSWTAYYNQQLPGVIAQRLHADWWKCYGVSGATMGDMAGQIKQAGEDTSFDNETITHIVMICGTNNIFDPGHDGDLEGETKRVVEALAAYYPHAQCHWFPDNSRTDNGDRTRGYATILHGFQQWSPVACHMDLLWILAYNNFEFYRTDSTDRENLQHLTPHGYEWLGGWIAGQINGDTSTILATAHCRVQYYEEAWKWYTGQSDIPTNQIAEIRTNWLIEDYADKNITAVYGPNSFDLWFNFGVLKPNPVYPPNTADRRSYLTLAVRGASAQAQTPYGQFPSLLFIPEIVETYGIAYGGIPFRYRQYPGVIYINPIIDTQGKPTSTKITIQFDKGDETSPWINPTRCWGRVAGIPYKTN